MAIRVLVLGVILGMGIVAVDEFQHGQIPPRPHRFWGVGTIFAILGVLAVPAPAVAAAFAIAVDVALVLRQTPAGNVLQPSVSTQTPVMRGTSEVAV